MKWCNSTLARAVYLFVSVITITSISAAAAPPQSSKREIAPKRVTFFSEGVKLVGDLYIPEGLAAGEKRAGIVLCYGYTGVRTLYEPPTAQALSQAGYVVLIFDYKGWGESDGPKTRLSPYGRVIDTQAALTFLSIQPQVDANRVGLYGSSYGGATVIFTAAIDPRVKTVVSVTGVGNGLRWMRSIRRPDEYADMLDRAAADRAMRVTTGKSEFVERNEILIPDRLSARIAAETRKNNPLVVSKVPLEYIDDTAGFNPEWVVDKIAPRPALFVTTDNDRLIPGEVDSMYAHANEPKKLVVLKGFGHYELYSGEGFRQLTEVTLSWFTEKLPARATEN
jgi:fermentation-respiration switch protein FrsA (DUF1100 family)